MSTRHPSQQILSDLAELFPQVASDLKCWEGRNLLITGGTGFFGKWLLEAIHFARENGRISLGPVFVLSRDPEAFVKAYPHLQNFDFIQGDIRSFKFPTLKLHGLIHGATTASAKLNSENPTEMFDTIVEGTRQALRCVKDSPGCRFLMISSGAVYGKKTLREGPSKEEDFEFSDLRKLNDAYADGKREAERLSVSSDLGQSTVIARCFAFVGPYLPLREHFAIGNFISNVLNGQEILIRGDGSPRRTYLYPTDLVAGLLALITRGKKNRAYNLGSNTLISIQKVAEAVSTIGLEMGLKEVPIKVFQQAPEKTPPHCYAPDIERARNEQGLSPKIQLNEAIRRTLKYYLETKDKGSKVFS